MGDVVKFRKVRRKPAYRGWHSTPPNPKRPDHKRGKLDAIVWGLIALAILSAVFLGWSFNSARAQGTFKCQSTRAIDGDTFKCDSITIRMTGIDAPELPGHCRPGRDCTPGDPYASTENLRRLLRSAPVQCRQTDKDSYGRTVGRCTAGDADLSCKQIEGGFAVRRYAFLSCEG